MAEGKTTVTEPALSRDHSERMLKAFGAEVLVEPDICSATVVGPAQLKGQSVIVPGDISSAAFWLVAGAIVPGSNLLIENVGINPTRTGILDILEMMGADISLEQQREAAGEPVADIRVRASSLKACAIEGGIIPRLIDEIPILAVAAAVAQGTTHIRNAEELRVKESDRLTAIASQLALMGVSVTEHPDGLDITGGTLQGAEVDSFTDHRIGMSLAIAALVAANATIVHRAEAAAISYPDFENTLATLCN
jgi:3-phosphoshikimate 1-carboxyvinyltransferase